MPRLPSIVLCDSFTLFFLRYIGALLYYTHMEVPRYSLYRNPSGCGYTAALYTFDRGEAQVPRHWHDFYEIMYVLEGEAVHEFNGVEEPLAAGDLFYIRPDDIHAIYKRSRRGELVWVNVEFSVDAWSHFAAGAGPEAPADFPRGRLARLGVDDRDECARVFQRALNRYFESPRRRDWAG